MGQKTYVAAAALMLLAQSAAASDQRLPATTIVGENSLQRCAVVPMKVFAFVKIGDAGLYLPKCSQAGDIMERIPKQFTIALSRDASGSRLQDMAEDLLEENLGDEVVDNGLFDCITQFYIDASEDDLYDVRYIPQQGLELRLNDEILATCDDHDQAHLYFSIWFGEEPFNQRLKQALLERSQEQAEQTDNRGDAAP
ncbi:MAG: hypothetical protein Tsb002_16740 [Wenzhouxiangellaceae bacterium]